MSFVLSTVMDAIAQELKNDGVTQRAFGYPLSEPTPPCVVVGYPTRLDYDLTFHALTTTGKITATFPVYFIVSKVIDKATRDALSAVITGAPGIKESLDGNLAGACDTCRVIDCTLGPYTIAGIDWQAARFDLEVIG